MSKLERALSIGLGCFGVLLLAAGVWFWNFLVNVTATDVEPFRQAQVLMALGVVFIVAAVLVWRRAFDRD